MGAMSSVPSLGPRGEGWVVLQLVALGLVAAGGVLAPGTAGLPDAATSVGLVLLLAGGTVALLGLLALREARAVSPLPHPRPGMDLVVTGPYAYVRHPVYAGLIVLALGWAVLQDAGPALVATAVLAIVLDLKRRREEAYLERHVAAYGDYRARTRALIPFLY
jgi:protein-S-isoprenylcysteine O-methyltransferase Ste14